MKTREQLLDFMFLQIEELSLGRHLSSTLSADRRILHDLQFDSLDYASLMLACEEWSGVRVSDEAIEWAKVETIGSLADLFISKGK